MPDTARVVQMEPLGPLAPVTKFRNLAEALTRANTAPFGLASYAFTRDTSRASAVSRALKAGIVGINTFLVAHAEDPFGGVDRSSMGREGGRLAGSIARRGTK